MPGRAKAIMGTTKRGGYRTIISRNLDVAGVEKETDLIQEPSFEGVNGYLYQDGQSSGSLVVL